MRAALVFMATLAGAGMALAFSGEPTAGAVALIGVFAVSIAAMI